MHHLEHARPEPLKTHLQLNVAKLGNFNALRVATEDYLRNRHIIKTTSAGNTHDEDSMEVDAISRKGKGKRESKGNHSSKSHCETTTDLSRFEGDCRKCGKYGHKAADTVGTSSRPNLKAKARAQESRNPKRQKSVKATAINKSKKPGHQTRLHRNQVCLKRTRLDAQMRDSGYSR